jgi:signal transduction histidine kinase
MSSNAPSGTSVFLSHAGADSTRARELAEALRRQGIEVWFDKDNLRPGDEWMGAIEAAIQHSSGMLVYVGRLGVQQWSDREVRLGIERNTISPASFRLIPVLGEGSDPASLPPFLRQHQHVDLRDSQMTATGIQRIVEVLKNPLAEPTFAPTYWHENSPFRGLQTFNPEDSWLFFGRDVETADLVARLGRSPVLTVIGNSGSGKSSLVRAGLIPALRRGRFRSNGTPIDSWRLAIFRPSESPFDYLSETLPLQLAPEMRPQDCAEFIGYCRSKLPMGGETLRNAIASIVPSSRMSGTTSVLLVADQFEEIFSPATPQQERDRYIDSLLAAARPEGPVSVRLVLVLRADFYANCLDHPDLTRHLETNLYNVGPVRPTQLSELIEKRLALAGAGVEPGLLDTLLTEVNAEPGDLALLEHALGQLWDKCGGPGQMLTSNAYAAIGRIRGSLSRHADEVCGQFTNEVERSLTQEVFLQLVHYCDDAPETRRRVPKEALLELGPRVSIERVLDRLASNRLVTISSVGPLTARQYFVEVSHEALITHWPSLRGWIAEDRSFLVWRDHLLLKVRDWLQCGREEESLLAGTPLADAERQLNLRRKDLPISAREFIEASIQDRVRKESERLAEIEKARRLKELEEQHAAAIRTAEDVMHQLRSPLAAMGFYLERAIKQHPEPDDLQKTFRTLHALWNRTDQSARSGRLFADLAVGRTLPLDLKKVTARELIRTLEDLIQDVETSLDPERRIRWDLQTHQGEATPRILVDTHLFEQAVMNILDNAAKYTFQDTTITVSARWRAESFVVSVSNVGLQLGATDAQRAAERGYRGEKARLVTAGGTGIGLWVTSEILKAHGGKLEIFPTDAAGVTVVSLWFPTH